MTRLSRKYDFKVVVVTAENSRNDVIHATLKKLHLKREKADDYNLMAEIYSEGEERGDGERGDGEFL